MTNDELSGDYLSVHVATASANLAESISDVYSVYPLYGTCVARGRSEHGLKHETRE